MASGRPRQPKRPERHGQRGGRDEHGRAAWPHRADVALALRTRPDRRVLLGTIGIGVTLGPSWLIAAAAATTAVLAAALTWPPSRQRITARAWCVITPAGCGPAARRPGSTPGTATSR